jgi:hypothetical protein
MIREFNEQWEKDYLRKQTETLEAQTVRRKSAAEQNAQREDIDEQWEKVEVMKRKTGNLRTTMRMSTRVEVLPNGQEHIGESCSASTSELVQWSGQLQTTVVTLQTL